MRVSLFLFNCSFNSMACLHLQNKFEFQSWNCLFPPPSFGPTRTTCCTLKNMVQATEEEFSSICCWKHFIFFKFI